MTPNDKQDSNNTNNQASGPRSIIELTPQQSALVSQHNGVHHYMRDGEEQIINFNLRRETPYSHANSPLNLLANSLSNNNESDNESNDESNSRSLDR